MKFLTITLLCTALLLPFAHSAEKPLLTGSQDLTRVREAAARAREAAARLEEERRRKAEQDQLEAKIAEERRKERAEAVIVIRQVHAQVTKILSVMDSLSGSELDAEKVLALYDDSIRNLGLIEKTEYRSGYGNVTERKLNYKYVMRVLAHEVRKLLPRSSPYRVAANPAQPDLEHAERRLANLILIADLFAEKRADDAQKKYASKASSRRAWQITGLFGFAAPVAAVALAEILSSHFQVGGTEHTLLLAGSGAVGLVAAGVRLVSRHVGPDYLRDADKRNLKLSSIAGREDRGVDQARHAQRKSWLESFVRSLEQHLGIVIAPGAVKALVSGDTTLLAATFCEQALDDSPAVRTRVATDEQKVSAKEAAEAAYEETLVETALAEEELAKQELLRAEVGK